MRINLALDGVRSFRISKKILRDVARVVSQTRRATNNTEVNVVITTPKKSKILNKKYRGKDYIPDVLTFRYPDSHEVLGEMIIVPEVVKKQARERKHTQETEFTILLVHGIVHMLGFEHEGVSRAKKTAMKRLETSLLSELGLELSDRSY
jgi:probable rRNA maturation factor